MSAPDPTSADLPDLPPVPAWASPLTRTQYADAVRCADAAPPLSARQRATLRAIFASAALGSASVRPPPGMTNAAPLTRTASSVVRPPSASTPPA